MEIKPEVDMQKSSDTQHQNQEQLEELQHQHQKQQQQQAAPQQYANPCEFEWKQFLEWYVLGFPPFESIWGRGFGNQCRN